MDQTHIRVLRQIDQSLAKLLADKAFEVTPYEAKRLGKIQEIIQELLPEDQIEVTQRKYPYFFREGRTLMKIGWSPTRNEEYQHRTPLSVLLDLVQRLLEATESHDVFTVKNLDPVISSQGRHHVPTYQVYMTLGWLKHEGLLIQNERSAYSLPEQHSLLSNVMAAWHRLPQKEQGYGEL